MTTIENNQSVETFADGSQIITDAHGNRTVIGKLAHDEYFKRLSSERIFRDSPPCVVVAFCKNIDGTRKAELIRKIRTNPISIENFGLHSWEVWTCDDPQHVIRYATEAEARKAFTAAMVHGTNGFGVRTN